MTARRLSLLAAVVAAVVALSVMVASLVPMHDGERGVALVGGPFELVDHHGQTVSEASYAGRLLLVYFGYSFCPDVCPTELAAMVQAVDLLGDDGEAVQPLFVTVDPARDTVEAMAEYVAHFYPRLVGLTGSADQVAAAAKAYRVYYAKGEGEDDAYLMDHSSFIYLMGRDGRYLAHFGPNTAPEEMARRIRELM